MNLGHFLAGQSLDERRLTESNGEDGVTARTGVVHSCTGGGAVCVAALYQLLGIVQGWLNEGRDRSQVRSQGRAGSNEAVWGGVEVGRGGAGHDRAERSRMR